MKIKVLIFFAGLIVLLVFVDREIVARADKYLLERDAEYQTLFKGINLVYSQRGSYSIINKKCIFNYIYYFYAYQICLVPWGKAGEPGIPGNRLYQVVYYAPRPKFTLFLRGDSPDNYYFKENHMGNKIKTVRID